MKENTFFSLAQDFTFSLFSSGNETCFLFSGQHDGGLTGNPLQLQLFAFCKHFFIVYHNSFTSSL